jgi:H+/Cl- antiporter ClcA
MAVAGTGALAGVSAGLLTRLLELIQRGLWGGDGTNILWAAQHTSASRCFLILLAAGTVTGLGQLLLKRLSSGNGIDTTAAIWFYAGRLPALRTLGSAVLSIIVVAMGASLGREGAPKQAAAVFANWFSDIVQLSEEQRRLLVSCGAGAGMAAAYGVPLGGALFSLEVLRGVLALRYILPALFCSIVATVVAWAILPNAVTYSVPSYPNSGLEIGFAVLCGLIAGPFSVLYVRLVTWAERGKPTKWQRTVVPILGLGLLGLAATKFPQLLGNGKDAAELIFMGTMPIGLTAALFVLKPAAILLCVRCGVPGGLFTPSLTSGALLGSAIGYLGALVLPQVPIGLCGILGAGAVLAATTQGPLSAVVLMLELTGRDRSFILPLLLAATIATLISRSIEPRSIYDARLTDEEIRIRQQVREKAQVGPDLSRD